jgi:hypothetical protein
MKTKQTAPSLPSTSAIVDSKLNCSSGRRLSRAVPGLFLRHIVFINWLGIVLSGSDNKMTASDELGGRARQRTRTGAPCLDTRAYLMAFLSPPVHPIERYGQNHEESRPGQYFWSVSSYRKPTIGEMSVPTIADRSATPTEATGKWSPQLPLSRRAAYRFGWRHAGAGKQRTPMAPRIWAR